MSDGYVELHAKSFYSFGLGASHTHELLARAREYGYDALALTDTNLCGALEFARLAGSLGVQPITGGELTLADGSRLVLLAGTREGYANISRLFTLANAADRREPKLDPKYLLQHTDGVVLLTGGRNGPLDRLLGEDRRPEALRRLRDYLDRFGGDRVFVELQQNFLQGDAGRNRELASLAAQAGAALVATNDVPWWPPNTTPPWTRPCPLSTPTGTCASSRPRGWRSFLRSTRRRWPTPGASPGSAVSTSAPTWDTPCRNPTCPPVTPRTPTWSGCAGKEPSAATARLHGKWRNGCRRSSS